MVEAGPSDPPTLNFISLNSSSPSHETILLIHSGFSSHREFTPVTPHLSPTHHLLIPDLPSHGRSTSRTIPFSPLDTIVLLADLIAKEAKSGKAHIVGISLGGFLGLLVASKYPDLVKSVFVTGCGRDWRGSRLSDYVAAFMFAIAYPTTFLSVAWQTPVAFKWLYEYLGLTVPDGLQEDQRAAAGYGMGFTLAKGILNGDFPPEWLERVKARTLLVAAGLDDDVEGTRRMGLELRKRNGESRAAKVEGKRHIWNLQDGELFARGVEAWLMDGRVLEEFDIL
jgi:pimeloyl-ACP methyl ester carboxylesterase